MNLNEECLLDYLSCLLGKPKTTHKSVVPVVSQHMENTDQVSVSGELDLKKHPQHVNELIRKSLQ